MPVTGVQTCALPIFLSTRSGLGIVIPAGSKTTLTTRFCSASAAEHHTRTDFTGTDAKNNRINFHGPDVVLAKR